MTGSQKNARPVLVVEDDAPVRRLMETLLRRAGFAVIAVPDGTAVSSILEREPIDVIILDMMMPVSSGFDVLKWLTASEPEVLKKIIVTTASADRQLRKFDATAVFAVIRKPFDIDLFLRKVEECASSDASGRTTPSSDETEERDKARRDAPVIRADSIDRFVSGAFALRRALSGSAPSHRELLLRAELRGWIDELSGAFATASELEADQSRAAMFRGMSQLARDIAGAHGGGHRHDH